MKVTVGDFMVGNIYTLPLATYSPGVFGVVDSQTGSIGTAKRGDTVLIFCNGLGPVSNQPASGEVAYACSMSAVTGTLTARAMRATASNISRAGTAPPSG